MGIEVAYQEAIYSVLNAAVGSLGLQGVYDVAPQVSDGGSAAGFPYVTIGAIFPVMSDTQTKSGFEVTTRIHVWSRSGAMRECKVIQGGIYDMLHKSSLSVTGFNSYLLLRNDSETVREPDGTIHGVCEYRGLIEYAT